LNSLRPNDQLGRPLHDLRISVTDRCNFRCTYCMPREVFGADYPFLPRGEILSFEEITRLTRVFASLGVEKIRLTGGEPLLRRDLPRLVGMLRSIDGIQDLALTTNGSLLDKLAVPLREAGLGRLTVSLDSLNDAIFAAINDAGFPVDRVLRGIDAGLAAGFAPIKINMVVKRGVNDHEVAAMAERFSAPELILRFIEYMDVGHTNGWKLDDYVAADEIVARLETALPLVRLPPNYAGEVARRYRHPSGGEIGVISSVSQPFCRGCTRARMSADGRLFTCLFATHGYDLRGPLRGGASDEELRRLVGAHWAAREDRYSEIRFEHPPSEPKAEMSLLGG
jgi:cyclic pyranopterin phosphate synthase